MASVYRKQRRWWIRYKDVAGRWKDIPTTKADTKALAKLLAHDLEHKIERQRLGLDPILTVKVVTFGRVMDEWWAEHQNLLRSKTIQPCADKHLRPALGDLVLGDITSGKLEQLFNAKLAELSPQSINHLRSYVPPHLQLRQPAGDVDGRKPGQLGEEVQGDQEEARVPAPSRGRPGAHRPGCSVAGALRYRLLHGPAKGRAVGALEERRGPGGRHHQDPPLQQPGDHQGRPRGPDPLDEELLPYLVEAMKQSKSDLLFSKPDGTQYPADLAQHLILRRAMGRAGIVEGYKHKCRRKGCGFEEKRTDAAESKCPRCSMKLWVKPIPRPTRFHDTRHTTATLLLKAGVPLAVVQKVLRHTDPAIAAGVYGHLDMDDMRKAVNTLGESVRVHLLVVGSGPLQQGRGE